MKLSKTSREELDRKIASVSAIDWARLAAFIDSEGTIYVNSRTTKSSGSVQHCLSLSVPNVSMALMGWLRSTFGGSIALRDQRTGRPCYGWRVNGSRVAELLTHCLPYLVLRGEQALIALQFQQGLMGQSKIGRPSPWEIRRRCSAQRAISTLNNMHFGEWQPPKVAEGRDALHACLASASPTLLAQLASFIDAEGTIFINRQKRGRWNDVFTLMVCIVNTNPRLFTWIASHLAGGGIYRHPQPSSHKICFKWMVSSVQAELVLRYCLPYFIVKQEQAAIAVAFRELIDSNNKQKNSAVSVQAREEMRNRIHVLNSPSSVANIATKVS